MRSVMPSGHNFATIPRAEIQRSRFDRSHGYKTTFNAGLLIPCFVDEVLPGDTFQCAMHAFARLATPIKPFMDNLFLESFFFFVPTRLLWSNWEEFNGYQQNPGDSTDFLVPQVSIPAGGAGWPIGSLADYFGIPTGKDQFTVNAFPFRAYNLIHREWFRDENLVGSVGYPTGDGPDSATLYSVLRRGKRHDYFTSSLPFPQKGPAVSLPLGVSAPVVTNNLVPTVNAGATIVNLPLNFTAVTNPKMGVTATAPSATTALSWGTITGMQADLTNATSATINSLRQAFQLQKMYERDARGGTRYIEIIKSHFGVTSPDARLQRPEYLGGGSSMINVNTVAQTSANASQPTPQGNLSAFATGHISGHGFNKSFVEHGWVIGIVNVRADLSYQQGLNRMWSRSTRFDFYWPTLSHLGEQAVLNKEIYLQGAAGGAADNQVFGYQERYAEYRYKPSLITGQFRSSAATPLDFWHLAQNFTALPVLNQSFIEDNPPIARVIAVPSEPHFLFDAYFNLQCTRPMPVYSVPGLIDHF